MEFWEGFVATNGNVSSYVCGNKWDCEKAAFKLV